MTHGFDQDYWQAHWQAREGGVDEATGARQEVRDLPPNPYLVDEIGGLPAGRALDAGCGEGAEAIWLAAHGWDVTGADISAEALTRAEQRAERHGAPAVRWLEADLSVWAPDAPFDLVTTHYAHAAIPQLEFYRRLAEWVAPGGTLFIVGHRHDGAGDHSSAHDHGQGGDDDTGGGHAGAHVHGDGRGDHGDGHRGGHSDGHRGGHSDGHGRGHGHQGAHRDGHRDDREGGQGDRHAGSPGGKHSRSGEFGHEGAHGDDAGGRGRVGAAGQEAPPVEATVTAAGTAANLDPQQWRIETADERTRSVPDGAGGTRELRDVVVRATRLS